jgi:cytosine/adenosine deaminase-related metal-dependent hydrolase
MLSAGVHVAIGTDSRASNPDLSLLAELRFVAAHHTAISREKILQLGTLAGAQALGQDHEVGSLSPGKLANLAIVPLATVGSSDPHELILQNELPVAATYYRGARVSALPATNGSW